MAEHSDPFAGDTRREDAPPALPPKREPSFISRQGKDGFLGRSNSSANRPVPMPRKASRSPGNQDSSPGQVSSPEGASGDRPKPTPRPRTVRAKAGEQRPSLSAMDEEGQYSPENSSPGDMDDDVSQKEKAKESDLSAASDDPFGFDSSYPPDADTIARMVDEMVENEYRQEKKSSSVNAQGNSVASPPSVDALSLSERDPSNSVTAPSAAPMADSFSGSPYPSLSPFCSPAKSSPGPGTSLQNVSGTATGVSDPSEFNDDSVYEPIWRTPTKVDPRSASLNLIDLDPLDPDPGHLTFVPGSVTAPLPAEEDEDSESDEEDMYSQPPPTLPPPPLPVGVRRNLVAPPPIPARPDNVSYPGQQQQQLGGYEADRESSIFSELETPQDPFKDDPFKYSSFGAVCKDYNKYGAKTLPELPGPNPLYECSNFRGSQSDGTWIGPGDVGGTSGGPSHPGPPPQAPARQKTRVSLSKIIPAPSGPSVSSSCSSSIKEDSESLYSLAAEARARDKQPTGAIDESAIGSDSSEEAHFALESSSNIPITTIATPAQAKKNERFGYLYKQGGVKANKGWRKRWVVFSGRDLRYYLDNKSQISKCIIPLSRITNVEPAIKDGDDSRFKFKIATTLNGRIYWFASESLEDALKWCNTIMAAVQQYSKQVSNGSGAEDVCETPEKEGYIRFENGGRRYYVAISGSILTYYRSEQDYHLGSPIHEIDMKMASIKDFGKGNNKLQLSTNYAYFVLAFEAALECQQWKMAIEDAIAEGLADDTVLDKVYENEDNKICADCGSSDPHWASINLGITLCKKCAGIHRNFDYTISKVKSLRMDTRVWTPSLIELMKAIGNRRANEFWEGELEPGQKLDCSASMDRRLIYIQNKYREKKYCRRHPRHSDLSLLHAIMLQTAATEDVLQMMQIVFSGADILYHAQNTEDDTAFKIAKAAGQRLQMEFLYQNGGDRSAPDIFDNDEGRMREDVSFQGYLLKTGPNGKTFERRWCVLEHGTLSYYVSEKSNTAKDSIERKHILCLWQTPNEKQSFAFEISTNKNANRMYLFAAEREPDRCEWMQYLSRLICPVCVMEHVSMMDFQMAGNFYVKDSMAETWRRSWLMLCGRTLHFVDKSMKMESLDLRKANSIKLQSADASMQLAGEVGPHFVINAQGRALYIQADLPRDTERLYNAFESAIKKSGATLDDQQLTNDDIPVIVEKCISHVELHGMQEEGIFRLAATNHRVQQLLNEFRRDAQAVRMDDYTIHEVANALKRFLRELADPLFTKHKYKDFTDTSQYRPDNIKISWYQYHLDKLPLVNYRTLKRLAIFLARLSKNHEKTKMDRSNLASCFAPSLMETEATGAELQQRLPLEWQVVNDVITEYEQVFRIQEREKTKEQEIQEAKDKIMQAHQAHSGNRTSQVKGAGTMILTFHVTGIKECTMQLSPSDTAQDVLQNLASKRHIDWERPVLLEVLRDSLTRPLFPTDVVMNSVMRWTDFDGEVSKSAKLWVENSDLMEKLKSYYDPGSSLFGEFKYSDKKSFSKKSFEFKQMRLTCYKDSKGHVSWTHNVEDLVIYKGVDMRRANPPPYGFTFLVKDEPMQKGYFGRSVGMSSEAEMMRWLAMLYFAQCPEALAGDSNGSLRS